MIGGTTYDVLTRSYSMEDVESLDSKGPCCSANGQFSSTNVTSAADYVQ